MSYIIVATDFSETAANAVDYACGLAREYKLPLTIVHSFVIPVSFGENPMPLMPLDEGREIAESRMKSIVDDCKKNYPDVAITDNISFGDIVDTLQELAEERKPLLIVLGNSTNKDELFWLGSNLISAMRHVKVPVLGIPGDYKYNSIKNICYSCDFKTNEDFDLAQELIELAKLTNAQLNILYIDKQTNESSDEQRLNMEGSKLHQSLKAVKPVYHFLEKESIDEGVQEFLAQNNMDWLVVVPHAHSLFESIFKKSHTKSLVRKITIPLLALHEH